MGDIFLLAVFLGIGILGYYLMGKVDGFLEENYREIQKVKKTKK